jgi:hypothetical protein
VIGQPDENDPVTPRGLRLDASAGTRCFPLQLTV